ncbi:MAG: stage II sporulation protein P, partial [Candidatus Spyradocola sp.]
MKRRILAALLCLCAALTIFAPSARADEGDAVWTLVTAEGEKVTSIAVEVTEGDEYIAGDNALYRVTSVDSESREAVLQRVGEEPAVTQAFFGLSRTAQTQKVVGLYCTHSDESYEDGDGTSSVESGWAGIHDVAATLKSWLEDKGIEVLFDTGSYLPHDAGAYRRSRSAAVELASQNPAALFDVHRDGIPDAEEYETEVDGEPVTMVRLLVGRSNPNSQENRQFAVQLKSVADEYYPGL